MNRDVRHSPESAVLPTRRHQKPRALYLQAHGRAPPPQVAGVGQKTAFFASTRAGPGRMPGSSTILKRLGAAHRNRDVLLTGLHVELLVHRPIAVPRADDRVGTRLQPYLPPSEGPEYSNARDGHLRGVVGNHVEQHRPIELR